MPAPNSPCGCSSRYRSPPSDRKSQFAIGFWVDPPARTDLDARYAEIAEANFTFIIGNFGAGTSDEIARQLALCEKYGLQAIVLMGGKPPELLPTHDACWGYFLADEPGAGTFPELRKAKVTPPVNFHPLTSTAMRSRSRSRPLEIRRRLTNGISTASRSRARRAADTRSPTKATL